jgi:hypothetical protein
MIQYETTKRAAHPTLPNGHLPPREVIPDVLSTLSSEDDYIQVTYEGLGGTGTAVGTVLDRMSNALSRGLMTYDTDIKVLQDSGLSKRAFHLTGRGNFSGIIENREKHSFIANGGLPACTEAWPVNEGVGLVRFGTTALAAYNLDRLKVHLHQSLEDALAVLQGPVDKRLVCHYALCPGGGTGSALVLPLTILTLDAARAISSTLQVTNVVHCVSPSAFLRSLRTPGERQRLMANSAKFFKELKFSLRQENLAALEKSLCVSPLRRPPVDFLLYYGNTDAANSIQSRERIHARIAVNILASRNQELQALEAARAVNPATILHGSGRDEAGTAVLGTEATVIAQVCTTKIAAAAAAREQSRQLTRHLAPEGDSAAVEALFRSLSATLQLERLSQLIHDKFRQNTHRFQMPVLDKVSTADALVMCEKAASSAVEGLRLDLEQKAEQLAEEVPSKVSAILRKFSKACAEKGMTLSRFRAVLAAALTHAEQKLSAVADSLERLPAEAGRRRFELARKQLAGGSFFRWKAKGRRSQARAAFQEVINGEVQQASDRAYHDLVLVPVVTSLKATVENCDRLHQTLHAVRGQLASQLSRLEAALGYENTFYTEVVRPEEVPMVLQRAAVEVPAKFGPHPELDFEELLAAKGKGEFAQVLAFHAHAVRARVFQYFQEVCQDLAGFCQHFSLAFDLKQFLAANANLVLPCRLDLAAHGPAHVPLQAFIVTPESLKTDALGVVQSVSPTEYEWVAGPDPFEVILRARMTKAPFSALPDRAEMLRHFEEFHASAPRDTVYGYLDAHLSLKDSDATTL